MPTWAELHNKLRQHHNHAKMFSVATVSLDKNGKIKLPLVLPVLCTPIIPSIFSPKSPISLTAQKKQAAKEPKQMNLRAGETPAARDDIDY